MTSLWSNPPYKVHQSRAISQQLHTRSSRWKHGRLTRLYFKFVSRCNSQMYICYRQTLFTDVFKKQWRRACVSTHASCHAMAQNQLVITFKFSITSLLQVKTISTTIEVQLDWYHNTLRITIEVRKWLVYSSNRVFVIGAQL